MVRFVSQLIQPLILVLIAAGTVTVFLNEWVDASVIFGVVLVNAVIGFIQEGKAEAALAVAGAAHGSFLLVIMGLLISIPIVVWGSTLLLLFVERFPGFVYLGAGVLAVTAAKMISAEPTLKDAFAAYTLTVPALYAVIAGDAVSGLERYGIPAWIGAILGLVFQAAAD